MNKNVVFAILGVAVFAVLLVVVWERGDEEGGPEFEPVPATTKAEEKGETEKAPAPVKPIKEKCAKKKKQVIK